LQIAAIDSLSIDTLKLFLPKEENIESKKSTTKKENSTTGFVKDFIENQSIGSKFRVSDLIKFAEANSIEFQYGTIAAALVRFAKNSLIKKTGHGTYVKER